MLQLHRSALSSMAIMAELGLVRELLAFIRAEGMLEVWAFLELAPMIQAQTYITSSKLSYLRSSS